MESQPAAASNRWRLIGDAITFQIKLALDGLRDLILFPVSLFAALISLVSGGGDRSLFYDVVRLGERSERWINLFGLVRVGRGRPEEGVDAFVDRLETILLEQHRRGGITTSTKVRIDRLLDRLEAAAGRRSQGNDDPSC